MLQKIEKDQTLKFDIDFLRHFVGDEVDNNSNKSLAKLIMLCDVIRTVASVLGYNSVFVNNSNHEGARGHLEAQQ